jgi:H+/Cl- antiporter ClcA
MYGMLDLFLDVVADPSFMERNGRLVWVIVALLALGALVGLFIWRKRQKQREGDHPDKSQQP